MRMRELITRFMDGLKHVPGGCPSSLARIQELEAECVSLKGKIYAAMRHPDLHSNVGQILKTGFTDKIGELVRSHAEAHAARDEATRRADQYRAEARRLEGRLEEAQALLDEQDKIIKRGV